MDHAERRLQGHTKLETVALPAMGLLRDWLDAPSPAERRRTAFVIPPVPERAAPRVAEQPPPAGKVWRVGPQEALPSIAAVAKLARSGTPWKCRRARTGATWRSGGRSS
ncbi:MAG: hypothetical protein QM777_09175 [Pseudorhodoferax sp.]